MSVPSLLVKVAKDVFIWCKCFYCWVFGLCSGFDSSIFFSFSSWFYWFSTIPFLKYLFTGVEEAGR